MITLNDYKIEPTIFPDGTSQVWQLPDNVLHDCMTHNVVWWFENEAELIHLAQLNMLFETCPQPCTLFIPFLPYARQDKMVSNGSTFALSTFLRMLGTMKWGYMCAYDVHGEINLRVPKIHNIKPDLSWITDEDYATVIFPDESAWKRYKDIVPNKRQLYAKKVRNPSTGYIERYSVITSGYTNITSPAIVVDDLCDGGATFNILAESLPNLTLDLYVTHGIFSKGLVGLLAKYNRIYTTNTCYGADVPPTKQAGFVGALELQHAASQSIDNARKYHEFVKYVQKGRLVIEEIK